MANQKENFPTPHHPSRYSRPGQEGISQVLPADETGEVTQVNGGGEMQSWGDFALQNELNKNGKDDFLV
ncbi:hypothetical protein GJ688_15295 [Heliobacillus mobilis]|uniref:Uncharacterized protein n=1 Tax=Heliobacterium mobile TaxID=28064 RepID=A0A6I3SNQ3_HELMO|nr:hypothetical protein [Heliobacterium mobile]MTV50335.1 hypothetical protein [Heliobacterium mobile]